MASESVKRIAQKFCRADDPVTAKSVITPDFESKHSIPPLYQSKLVQKRNRKKERGKTKGEDWYNMPAPELTDELKNDLRALRMRDALDPKRFYKPNDTKGLPKYFQIGKIVDSPVDFYSSRIPKRQRKRTIVDELLQDAEFQRYRKRKAGELFKAKHQNARYFKSKKAKEGKKKNAKHTVVKS
ncbi:deoxynucleotidyltransferase terminal-interacting protein 2-like [Paramacrobiotus metropolitanus]|uniref:deoxynucleotidyltransferase terminal-interacting protein 2-like n=1 Tax=Paramacrobiotus metropolitanus TaxID=2943436 RepID=UPI00244595D8|nr:deoxynucleotidyltransferase terminal-interacting protein 2-like [Paramacrobiotus metropolitanus]